MEERVSLLKKAAHAGDRRCIRSLKLLSGVKRMGDLDPSEFQLLVQSNEKQLRDVCFSMVKKKKVSSVERARKWLHLAAVNGHEESEQATIIFNAFDKLGGIEKFELDIYIQGTSYYSVFYGLAWFRGQKSFEKAKRWLKIGTLAGCTYCHTFLSSLPSLEALGEIGMRELVSICPCMPLDPEGSTIDVHFWCYCLSIAEDLPFDTRKKWLRIGADLGDSSCLDLLERLTLQPDAKESSKIYTEVVNPIDHGLSAFTKAVQSTSFETAFRWFRIGSSSDTEYGQKSTFCLSSLTLATSTIQYEKDEAVYAASQLKGRCSRRGPSLTSCARVVDLDGSLCKRFLNRTLISGFLEKNHDTSIYRSFFGSGIPEVQVFPIVAKYLLPTELKEDELSSALVHEKETVSSLTTFSRLLMQDTTGIKTLTITRTEFGGDYPPSFLPLLFYKTPNITSLSIDMERVELSPDCFSFFDTSKLLNLQMGGSRANYFPPSCSFSSLERVFIYRDMTSLAPLCDLKDMALVELKLPRCRLQDISHLPQLDLSRIQTRIDFNSNDIRDLSCLYDVRYPVAISLKENPATMKRDWVFLEEPRVYGLVEVFWR